MSRDILIHTSVKLVTSSTAGRLGVSRDILIHTSVKLVTENALQEIEGEFILIHTSVKLVTLPPSYQFLSADNFNPHEREARDPCAGSRWSRAASF